MIIDLNPAQQPLLYTVHESRSLWVELGLNSASNESSEDVGLKWDGNSGDLSYRIRTRTGNYYTRG